MTLARILAAQLRGPSGLGGRVVARLMNAFNRPMHRKLLESLDPQPGDSVLEVGFGGASLLDELLRRTPASLIAGVELSPTMLERARGRLARELRGGRLRLADGAVDRLPFGDGDFDRAVSANTIYFWPDPDRGARELRRVLRPAGVLVLGYGTPGAMGSIPVTRYGFRLYPPEEVEHLLRRAGFDSVVSQEHGSGRAAFVVTRASGSSADRQA